MSQRQSHKMVKHTVFDHFVGLALKGLKIDTVDGKDQLHGTAIAVYQQQLQNQTKVPIFQVLYLESQVNRILGLISPNIF